MNIKRVVKPAFTVIGKEGSTAEGPDFIQRLWNEANVHFSEVAPLARQVNGSPAGFWGAMSDMSRSFQPWEEGFTRGLYLAGVECPDDAQAPDGWTKWTIPGYEYLRAECEDGLFPRMLQYIEDHGMTLQGAVHDFTDPATGKAYMYFPVRRL